MQAGLLGSSLLASWLSASTLDLSEVPKPSIQPQKEAFAIWGVIYPSLGALLSYADRPDILPRHTVEFLAGSLALTVAWSAFIASRRWRLACLSLGASLLCAHVALSHLPPNIDAQTPTLLPRASIGLYVGWLGVAFALMMAIAFPTRFDDSVRSKIIMLANGTHSLLAFGNPMALAAVGWALLKS